MLYDEACRDSASGRRRSGRLSSYPRPACVDDEKIVARLGVGIAELVRQVGAERERVAGLQRHLPRPEEAVQAPVDDRDVFLHPRPMGSQG